jgi:hypothetical protein
VLKKSPCKLTVVGLQATLSSILTANPLHCKLTVVGLQNRRGRFLLIARYHHANNAATGKKISIPAMPLTYGSLLCDCSGRCDMKDFFAETRASMLNDRDLLIEL